MSGIIAVYALVIAVLIANDLSPEKEYDLFSGFMHLSAGLSVGLSGVAAGYAIGVVGDMVRKSKALFVSATMLIQCLVGSKIIHAAVPGIRWHGTDSHLWRSAGSIWVCPPVH